MLSTCISVRCAIGRQVETETSTFHREQSLVFCPFTVIHFNSRIQFAQIPLDQQSLIAGQKFNVGEFISDEQGH